MRFLLPLFIAGIFGLAAGGASALWAGGMLKSGPRMGNGVVIDGWTSDWSIGSTSANPYVRARIARNGLLALRKEEAVYFTRSRDEEGRRLDEACIYRISGGAMPSQWWSITLYDGDSRLPMNEDDALSFDANDAESQADPENWSFRISSEPNGQPGSLWVSSRSAGQFDVTLRLYLPSEALLADPGATLIPPRIERLFCEGEG